MIYRYENSWHNHYITIYLLYCKVLDVASWKPMTLHSPGLPAVLMSTFCGVTRSAGKRRILGSCNGKPSQNRVFMGSPSLNHQRSWIWLKYGELECEFLGIWSVKLVRRTRITRGLIRSLCILITAGFFLTKRHHVFHQNAAIKSWSRLWH